MKKIIFRKLLFDCLLFFTISLVSASLIIWIFQAVNFLDIILEDGRDYLIYLNYSLLNFPKIISKIIPFTIFFSFFYVFGKYENSNELIIFWTYGITKLKVVNFFLFFSFLLIILQISLTSFLIPFTQDQARSLLRQSEINYFDNFIKPKKFNDTVKDLTIYVENKKENNKLEKIYLKNGDFDKSKITYAQHGEIKKVGNRSILILYDGSTINYINNKITKFNFSRSDFELSNLESNTTTYIKTQETSSLLLTKCVFKYLKINLLNSKNFQGPNCRKENLNNVYKELYKRFIIPFYLSILILISLLMINNPKESLSYSRNKFFIFLFGLIVIIFSESTLGYINYNLLNNILFSIFPFIMIIMIYALFKIKFRFKR